MPKLTVAAFYRFVRLTDFVELRDRIEQICRDAGILGTVLVAEEGINGTIAGSEGDVAAVLAALRADPRLSRLQAKLSGAHDPPFRRMKVRLKREIVTMGLPALDPGQSAGTYVSPRHWNRLISDPDVLVVDTRNRYETAIGGFAGAIDPQTKSFREFPAWVRELKRDIAAGTVAPPKKVAMYCTGGIRCEKSTAYMKAQGFDEVYHLEGGILHYLEQVPAHESLWRGECFVFDQRVSVGHGLKLGHYDQCHACRHPITQRDKASPKFQQGISCPRCFDERSLEQKKRYAARQRQVELARRRGGLHIGAIQSKPD